MEAYKKANSVSIYMSMPQGEVMTRKIVKDALAQGKSVYVPHLVEEQTRKKYGKLTGNYKNKRMDMVSLHSVSDFNRCEENRDRWGIPTVSTSSLENRRWILDTVNILFRANDVLGN